MSEHMFSFLACLFMTFYCTEAEPISFIKRCAPSDNKCLKESTQAALPIYASGVPELGIKSLDPLLIPEVDASSSGLHFIVTNGSLTGIKDCLIQKMKRDLEKSKIMAVAECNVNLEGNYNMDGRLLVLSLSGHGPLHVKLRKLVITVEVDIEDKIFKDGKKHWNIKSYNHKFELKDKADVEFVDLLKENKIVGDTARDFIQNNGKEVVEEVGVPVIKAIITQLVKNVNRFFHKTPVEDLVLE